MTSNHLTAIGSPSLTPSPSLSPSTATVYTCWIKPAIAPSTAPLTMSVSSSASKMGCNTRSNSCGVISAIFSRIRSFSPSASSEYACSTCTWSLSRSFTDATTASSSAVSSAAVPSPRPWYAASVTTNSRVYCSSAASNSGPFRPVSMLSQIFSDVSTLLAKWSLNSLDTSVCRWRNRPWILNRPHRYTGSTGSKMHLSASQLVR
mmetsp:Transcript_13987/g.33845  ORF Transcript_13987/g.33845 Transcript_13987/m.33845 type:complete len:205 (-) Transcript_13987:1545-2159(-)